MSTVVDWEELNAFRERLVAGGMKAGCLAGAYHCFTTNTTNVPEGFPCDCGAVTYEGR